MKLSQRLSSMVNMIDAQYSHIWDCCCDHGLLGAALLTDPPRKQTSVANPVDLHTVHFVDIVPEIMQQLSDNLSRFFPAGRNGLHWRVHCQDVAKLPLAQFQTATPHLVIIAGVGGELTAKLVKSIQARADASQQEVAFMLCPVHHTYQLRAELSALGLGLIDERLITDNKRHYEIIHVGRTAPVRINAIGDRLWQGVPLATQTRYLKRLLAHYTKVKQGLSRELTRGQSQRTLSALAPCSKSVANEHHDLLTGAISAYQERLEQQAGMNE